MKKKILLIFGLFIVIGLVSAVDVEGCSGNSGCFRNCGRSSCTYCDGDTVCDCDRGDSGGWTVSSSSCSGCKTCSSGSCVSDDSQCSGCQICSGDSCVDDDGNCNGYKSCVDGSCINEDDRCENDFGCSTCEACHIGTNDRYGECRIVSDGTPCGDNKECQDGSCVRVCTSKGNSCNDDGDCCSGHCVHGTCRSSDPYCGDGYCDSGEDCDSCSDDCSTSETCNYKDDDCDGSVDETCNGGSGVCSSGPGLYDYGCHTDYAACPDSDLYYGCEFGSETSVCRGNDGYVCDDLGDGSWDDGSQECHGGTCTSSWCGDGTCQWDEDCDSCSADCGSCCTTHGNYGTPCCSGLELSKGRCCNPDEVYSFGDRKCVDCISDSDCSTGEKCESNTCCTTNTNGCTYNSDCCSGNCADSTNNYPNGEGGTSFCCPSGEVSKYTGGITCKECFNDGDCSSGEWCSSNHCCPDGKEWDSVGERCKNPEDKCGPDTWPSDGSISGNEACCPNACSAGDTDYHCTDTISTY